MSPLLSVMSIFIISKVILGKISMCNFYYNVLLQKRFITVDTLVRGGVYTCEHDGRLRFKMQGKFFLKSQPQSSFEHACKQILRQKSFCMKMFVRYFGATTLGITTFNIPALNRIDEI
jgi:hypothetical protein